MAEQLPGGPGVPASPDRGNPLPVQRVAPGWEHVLSEEEDTSTVRPYMVTGGRTRSGAVDLPIEALVECLGVPRPDHSTESRGILELTAGEYLSVAELSAHLRLPVGVVRVLACDLSEEGLVRLHGLTTTESHPPAITIGVLESVLDGIAAL